MDIFRDHWGRPTWAGADWPFAVESITPQTQHTIVKIRLPACWASAMLDALEVLSAFVRQLEHHAACSERDRRTAARRQIWQARVCRLQAAYDLERKKGLGHRAAIRSIITNPDFSEFSFSDVNRFVVNPTRRSRLAAGARGNRG